jgi:hypothetical protein
LSILVGYSRYITSNVGPENLQGTNFCPKCNYFFTDVVPFSCKFAHFLSHFIYVVSPHIFQYKFSDLCNNKSVLNWTWLYQLHLKPNCTKIHSNLFCRSFNNDKKRKKSFL